MLGLPAAQWWFLLNLMRQNGRLLARLEALEGALAAGGRSPSSPNGAAAEVGLPVGSPAPDFELPDLGGGTLSPGSLRASGKPTPLVFTDPNCGPCQALLPEVGRWQRERAEGLTISLISQGEPEQNRAQAYEHGLRNVVIQEDSEVTESYGVWGTPSAVVVLPDGSIGSPLAAGVEQIENLADQHAQAFSRPERANHPLSPAPPVRALRPASRGPSRGRAP